ncbi:MAG: TIGR01777 family oxidoreductase [Proteobacteria bacterium]|nr:TIGR01777 family oxidoreductase [Pseudomonadota bacterium]
MHVFVTGATGFVGKPLVAALLARGDRVSAMSRSAARAAVALGAHAALVIVEGDLEQPGAWSAALAGADVVVHLAGEPVAGKRWDARQKQVIRDSRVEATRALVEAIAALPATAVGGRPRVLVSASGTDYYPAVVDAFDADDDVIETTPPGEEFLARVCRDWETEATAAEAAGLRVARLRIGAVLARGGGALDKILPSFKLFAGGSVGTGKQWFSWVHRDDVLAVLLAATTDARFSGAFNVVAPGVTRYREFAKVLGARLHRPSFFRLPGFVLKLAVGEFATAILDGRKVVPRALEALGFTFKFPELDAALAQCL